MICTGGQSILHFAKRNKETARTNTQLATLYGKARSPCTPCFCLFETFAGFFFLLPPTTFYEREKACENDTPKKKKYSICLLEKEKETKGEVFICKENWEKKHHATQIKMLLL